jgi:3-hydroxyacyl-[acyl-carrier-protein] dehydratase
MKRLTAENAKNTGKKLKMDSRFRGNDNSCNLSVVENAMRFILIDKVVSLESGKEIKTVKGVSLAEEYLADHFPTFPVLPGVLLLEGLIESASWLVREAENFAHSMILLEQARNVKYRSFLVPGSRIEYIVQAKTIEENLSSFTGFGLSEGQKIVEARFGLRHFNLTDDPCRQQAGATMAAVDARIIENMKKRWKLLR